MEWGAKEWTLLGIGLFFAGVIVALIGEAIFHWLKERSEKGKLTTALRTEVLYHVDILLTELDSYRDEWRDGRFKEIVDPTLYRTSVHDTLLGRLLTFLDAAETVQVQYYYGLIEWLNTFKEQHGGQVADRESMLTYLATTARALSFLRGTYRILQVGKRRAEKEVKQALPSFRIPDYQGLEEHLNSENTQELLRHYQIRP